MIKILKQELEKKYSSVNNLYNEIKLKDNQVYKILLNSQINYKEKLKKKRQFTANMSHKYLHLKIIQKYWVSNYKGLVTFYSRRTKNWQTLILEQIN